LDEKKRELIINEINYWRENNLLPTHYCDFLLNLYTEGGGKKRKKSSFLKLPTLIFFISFLVFTILILTFVFYLAKRGIPTQFVILLFLIFILTFFSLGWKYKEEKQISLIHFAIFSLILGIFPIYLKEQFQFNQLWLLVLLFVVAVIWLLTGLLTNYYLFVYIGNLSILLIYALIVFNLFVISLLLQQLLWLPFSFFLFFLWYLRPNKKYNYLLLANAILLFFAPEVMRMIVFTKFFFGIISIKFLIFLLITYIVAKLRKVSFE